MENKECLYVLEATTLMLHKASDEELKDLHFTEGHIAKAKYILNFLQSYKHELI